MRSPEVPPSDPNQTAPAPGQRSPARGLVAFQIGGLAGDVPGGVSQVVASYVGWPFSSFRAVAVPSRSAGRLPVRLKVWAAAVRHVLSADRRACVAVVHLSQRGSFVREGSIVLVARARRLGTVVHVHGSAFARFARAHPVLVRTVLARADRIVVLSDETEQAIRRLLPDARVHRLPNAATEGARRPKEDLVVFGGAVSVRKGADVLAEAWRGILDRHGWRLVVAGPAVDVHLKSSDGEGVSVVGALAHEELLALLERSKIAVLPSRGEALPMFILEALGRRNCVISTPVGAIAEVLDGVGVVVGVGDVDALRIALEGLMNDPGKLEQRMEAGYERFITRYSARSVFPRVEAVWMEALAARATSSPPASQDAGPGGRP